MLSYKPFNYFLLLKIRSNRYNEETRKPKVVSVLRAVRCQFLSPAFLQEQMKTCDIVTKLPACREYLSQIFMVSATYFKQLILTY